MKRWARAGFQVAGLLFFVLIVWWAGPKAWQSIVQAERGPLSISLALYGIAGIASATRLRLMTHAIHKQETVAWRYYFQANWVARAFGLVLPRTLSAVGGKSVALRSFKVPFKRSVWIVMVDNLFDVFLLALICLPAFLFLQGKLSELLFLVAVGVMILLALTAVWLVTLPRWTRRVTALIKKVPWLARKLNITDEESLLLPPTPAALQGVGWTVLLNLVLVFGFYFMARAVGSEAHWLLFLAAYPFVQLSLVAAVTPGGLGLFELGWLGLLSLGGLPESEAVTFAIAQRVYVAIFVLVWTGVSILLAFSKDVKFRLSSKTIE